MTWKNGGTAGWLYTTIHKQATNTNLNLIGGPNTPYYQVLSFKITIGLNHILSKDMQQLTRRGLKLLQSSYYLLHCRSSRKRVNCADHSQV